MVNCHIRDLFLSVFIFSLAVGAIKVRLLKETRLVKLLPILANGFRKSLLIYH